MNYRIIDFDKHGDDRGMLIALEEGCNIPFNIKRVYYMFNSMPNVSRGYHAHRDLKQVLVCVKGTCTILLDDGIRKANIELDNPYKGLYIEANMWREMHNFSEDAVLMVLASELYDESDYIRDYDEFSAYVSNNRDNRKV